MMINFLTRKRQHQRRKKENKNGKKDKASRRKKFVIFIKPKHAIHYKPFDLFFIFFDQNIFIFYEKIPWYYKIMKSYKCLTEMDALDYFHNAFGTTNK